MENLAVTTITPPHLMTVPEVAKYLRVDQTTVRRWIKIGALEASVLPSGIYRVKEESLNKVLIGK